MEARHMEDIAPSGPSREVERGPFYFIVWRQGKSDWKLRDGKALTARESSQALIEVEGDDMHDYAVVSAASKADAEIALTNKEAKYKGFVDLPVRPGDPGYDEMMGDNVGDQPAGHQAALTEAAAGQGGEEALARPRWVGWAILICVLLIAVLAALAAWKT
jgi:hypothetical protein